MEYPNDNTNSRKNKHLNFKEHHLIKNQLNNGLTPYKIAKELIRPINTILNEIKRSTTVKIKQGKRI